MKVRPTHCIVTPDFIGPIKNGGIGTACFELARFLSTQCDARVTILFTSVVTVDSSKKWKSYYEKKYNWRFLVMDDLPPLRDIPHHNCRWFLARSLQIHEWLKGQNYSHIHFQDWHANGFVPVQAKRSGLSYSDAVLTCTIHSPQEWSEEGNHLFPSGGLESMLQRYSEKYAASHADISIFPSRHMLSYVQKKQWNIQNPCIVPYLSRHKLGDLGSGIRHISELCFFGRLETRKGLEVFVGALERLINTHGATFLPKITFLGKPGSVKSGDSLVFLRDFQKRHALPISILTNLDANQAQDYLKADPSRVAVVPSLLDNLPYVVIECLQNDIPIIASKIGGIPELIKSEQHLFQPNPSDLAILLENLIANGCPPVESLYDLRKAEEWWKAIAHSSDQSGGEKRTVDPAQIAVCVAYYNYGKYLPDLLASLEKQTVTGFGVVVVNDGSSDDHSIKVFEEMQSKYAEKTDWKFATQANGGIGVARNRAASLVDSEYIVFMDADNLAKPQMIERMALAMGTSNADCLTCYMDGFMHQNGEALETIYCYMPTGNCPEVGCFENIFGDANCIVRRDAFEAVGKFSLDRDSSFEDWEFLAKMSLNGKRLDVIPEFLHLYRHTDQGFSRNTSAFKNRRRILNAYQAHLPGWAGCIVEGAYAFIADAQDVVSIDRRSQLEELLRLYYPLPTIMNIIKRGLHSLLPSFQARKYVSRYRHVMERRGPFIQWNRFPRLHYTLFGEKFPL